MYTVTIRKIHEKDPLRTATVDTVEDAEAMIESWREYYENRENVEWDGEEVDQDGVMNGWSNSGEIYKIDVDPAFPIDGQ